MIVVSTGLKLLAEDDIHKSSLILIETNKAFSRFGLLS